MNVNGRISVVRATEGMMGTLRWTKDVWRWRNGAREWRGCLRSEGRTLKDGIEIP